jgi:hypothetical protein
MGATPAQSLLLFVLCAAAIVVAGFRLSADALAEADGWDRGWDLGWVGLALLATVASLPERASGEAAAGARAVAQRRRHPTWWSVICWAATCSTGSSWRSMISPAHAGRCRPTPPAWPAGAAAAVLAGVVRLPAGD